MNSPFQMQFYRYDSLLHTCYTIHHFLLNPLEIYLYTKADCKLTWSLRAAIGVPRFFVEVPDFPIYRIVLSVKEKNLPDLPVAADCVDEIESIYWDDFPNTCIPCLRARTTTFQLW